MLFPLSLYYSNSIQADTVMAGDYTVHFTVISSLNIPPNVAQAHDITRSKSRLVLNVSVIKEGESGPAMVKGQVSNLLNQLSQLDFIEVQETSAVYYLATTIAGERDTLRYDLEVLPDGHSDTIKVRYLYQF